MGFAYRFNAKEYPNNTINELNKLPVDTFNRLTSAIERFNDVKTPEGIEPTEGQKDEAWENIKRSAEEMDYEIEVSDWRDIEKRKTLKKIKETDSGVFAEIKRAFVETETKKMFIEGIASSTLFDTFTTRFTKECMDDMALQINSQVKDRNYYPVILESTHDGGWDSHLGVVSEAWVEKVDGLYTLVIRAQLDSRHPMSEYLYRVIQDQQKVDILKDKKEKFPVPKVGFSINGSVRDFEILDDDVEEEHRRMSSGFKQFEGEFPIAIHNIDLRKIAITHRPSNPVSFVNGVVREAQKAVQEQSKNTIEWVKSGSRYTDKNLVEQVVNDKNNNELVDENKGNVMTKEQENKVAVENKEETTPAKTTSESKDVVSEESKTDNVEKKVEEQKTEDPEKAVEPEKTEEKPVQENVDEKSTEEVKQDNEELAVLRESMKEMKDSMSVFTDFMDKEQEKEKQVVPEAKEEEPQIDLSNYITREEHEQIMSQKDEELSLMRENLRALNTGFKRLVEKLNGESEKVANDHEEVVQREESTKQKVDALTALSKSLLDKASSNK